MKPMHKRRVTKEGRVNIPQEIMERFDIKEDDFVEVDSNRTTITIKKFKDNRTCAVTGKVNSHVSKFGEAYISKEGLDIIQKKLDASKK
jgi:transcriptional pleiotropic regulator of transition state genes